MSSRRGELKKAKEIAAKWDGVECSESGRVSEPDLSRNNESQLRGKISPALLDLKNLNYLDLSGFDFEGRKIPEFLGSLKNLTNLSLRHSNFTGEVPRQLGNLTNLQNLDLSDNYGLRIKNLDWLSRLSLLSYLDLSSVNLNKSDWLSAITKLPFLGDLGLSDCQLHDSRSEIDIEMNFANSSFSTLGRVDLSKNYLTSYFTFSWSFNFTRHANIVIYLSGNRLDGIIPDKFWEFNLA